MSLVACASTSGFPSGEMLIQPLPLPESGWVEYSKVDGSVSEHQWRKNDDPHDTFSTLTTLGQSGDVHAYHQFVESKGQQACSYYRSKLLPDPSQSSYPALVWLTRCKLEAGGEQTVLHLAIAGHDSFYTLRRTWPAEPSAKTLAAWQEYLRAVEVCDSRDSNAPCPDGYTKAVPEAV